MGLFTRGADRRGTPADLLVIGLANPGEEYRGTRHNAGGEAVELLADRHGGRLKAGKERALVDEVRIGAARVARAIPTTYMNLSGESGQLLVKRYGIEDPAQIVVVHDELDLELGRLKAKAGGGLAGHNGLRSLKQHLKTADFLRVRIGVGKPSNKRQGADHVLKKPGKADRIELDLAIQLAANAVEQIATDGIEAAMTAVNANPNS